MVYSAHVVVVGSGLAGLSSAIEAIEKGAKVTLLEKEKSMGGNSAKATSGMNGVATAYQERVGVHDSEDIFMSDTLKSGARLNEESLVRVLAAKSKEAIEWISAFGLDLSNLSQCGGHSVKRTHREPNRPDGKPSPIGWDIISKLKERLNSINDPEKFNFKPNCALTNIIIEENSGSFEGTPEVKGVNFKCESGTEETLLADAVILATGGYAHDWSKENSLLAEFAPQLVHLPTTNGPWATGDVIKLGRKLGLALVDMDKVQVHPTGFVDPKDPDNRVKFLAPEALRAHGGILVNKHGDRFVNELGPRDYVTAKIFENCQENNVVTSYLILNEKGALDFGKASLDFYQKKGLIQVAHGLSELGNLIQADAERLGSTLRSYNEAALKSSEDKYLKTVFPNTFSEDDTFYVARITPSIHYTMGGLRINSASEVQIDSGKGDGRFKSVLGLFAAGEVTGGVHGNNRLAGNSLLECVVFGRIAGDRASQIAISQPGIVPDEFRPLRFRERIEVGKETKIFRFDLPGSKENTGLSVGQYISVSAKIDGEDVIRYYSPISRPRDYGLLDLLIKVDQNGGKMSNFLNNLKPGESSLLFKGPMGGIKLDLSDRNSKIRKIGMICGGSGIAPMIQIIRSVLHYSRSDIEMKLIYGAVNEGELVFRSQLEKKASANPNLKLHFTLDKIIDPTLASNWPYGRGFINKSVIEKEMFPPANDSSVMVILCGPPAMCKAIKPIMKELGYDETNFYSFM